MSIPDTFVETFGPDRLKLKLRGSALYSFLHTFMKNALLLGEAEGEVIVMKMARGQDPVTFIGYIIGGWTFVALDSNNKPWSWSHTHSSLSWGMFPDNAYKETRMTKKAAINHFQNFQSLFMRHIGPT